MKTSAGSWTFGMGNQAGSDPRALFIDRWIFAFMAGMFIALSLLGFIPDSLAKVAAVAAGKRPPFPPILHIHAALMGAFLLVLLAQTVFVATGRVSLHRRLGVAASLLVPLIVVAGAILVPTLYHAAWDAAQHAPIGEQARRQRGLLIRDNILLLQLWMGVLFPVLMIVGLRARTTAPDFHKRMIILAVATLLPPSIDRIQWLPTTFPTSPLSAELYVLIAVSPMLAWDLTRRRSLHRAYLLWFGINLPFAAAVHALWGSPWWHAVAPRLMMV